MKDINAPYNNIKVLPFIIGTFMFSFTACTPDFKFHKSRTLTYPSGSGITYYNGSIFTIGDDATTLLITDTSFTAIDSLKLFDLNLKRIPKDIKPDLEAATVVYENKIPAILLVGSGSLTPYRNKGFLISPHTKHIKELDLTLFYKRINGFFNVFKIIIVQFQI